MTVKPKLFFDDEAEMLGCLHEWIARLGLSDWWIMARICPATELELPDVAGESKVDHVNKCGRIDILRREDMPDGLMIRQPQELALIHELLHFKFVGFEEKNRDEAYFELMQHQLLEEMAKALYMAKYNLTRSWFVEGAKKKGEKNT